VCGGGGVNVMVSERCERTLSLCFVVLSDESTSGGHVMGRARMPSYYPSLCPRNQESILGSQFILNVVCVRARARVFFFFKLMMAF